MNFRSLFFCACFASHLPSTTAATVIKILHINPQAKVRAIWQETAHSFESAHPGVKVEFDYLENEAFKAKLPTLLQSKDRPSIFHSWGGGVMVEQINSGICQDITQGISENGFKDTFYPLPFKPSVLMGNITLCPTTSRPRCYSTTKNYARRLASIRLRFTIGMI
jgi:raffinose/stachyose/melibiose transport system substrate-binding protein